MEKDKTVQINIRIKEKDVEALEKLAEKDHRTKNNYIAVVLHNHIAKKKKNEVN